MRMKGAAALALAMVLTLVGVTQPAAAHDGDERLHFKTEAAEARFETTDPVTGIVTSVWLYAADDALPERISKVIIKIGRYDPAACSAPKAAAEPGGGCTLFNAECYAELGDDAFAVDPNQLVGATLAGTVPCWEHATEPGRQIDLAVSVSWTATGEIEQFRDNALYHPDKAPGQPRGTETYHVQAFRRDATATGSIFDGSAEYFRPGPDAVTWIARAQQVNT